MQPRQNQDGNGSHLSGGASWVPVVKTTEACKMGMKTERRGIDCEDNCHDTGKDPNPMAGNVLDEND